MCCDVLHVGETVHLGAADARGVRHPPPVGGLRAQDTCGVVQAEVVQTTTTTTRLEITTPVFSRFFSQSFSKVKKKKKVFQSFKV